MSNVRRWIFCVGLLMVCMTAAARSPLYSSLCPTEVLKTSTQTYKDQSVVFELASVQVTDSTNAGMTAYMQDLQTVYESDGARCIRQGRSLLVLYSDQVIKVFAPYENYQWLTDDGAYSPVFTMVYPQL